MAFNIKTLKFSLILVFLISQAAVAQKSKKGNKKLEMYECGSVYKPSLKEKLNPMRALQKGIGGGFTDGDNADLGSAAISLFYQANLHPQGIMRYPTQTPGWETCGDAVFAGFTNKKGTGLSSTDGEFTVAGQSVEHAGMGTYFHGFKPDQRGTKKVKITSSNGNIAEVTVGPGLPLSIKSVDGIPKGQGVEIDGTKDIVIELEGADADPNSKLHVQLVCKLVGTPVIYDVMVTKARNIIILPKEAFKNFEGSPSPFSKNNTLIVNRVTETIIDNTDAGAFRMISAYMDWMPITISGDIAKGSIVTAGFDESKNTNIKIDLNTSGDYNFVVKKDGPYLAPPVSLMKKVAIGSFFVRGNLQQAMSKKVVDLEDFQQYLQTWDKNFPEMNTGTWGKLVDKLYNEFVTKLKNERGMQVVDINQVVGAKAYRYAKTLKNTVSPSFVEMGAGGTKRIIASSWDDLKQDMGITFPGDFVSERLVQELDVDAVLAVVIDLDFDGERESLDPKVHIVAFAPNVSYKTAARYFGMRAQTKAKTLDECRDHSREEDVIYEMIRADAFLNGFMDALGQLSAKESEYPVYETLWKAKL